MSLFPGHLKPGGILTIHLRSTAFHPIWVRKKVFIVDPNGKRTECLNLLQPFVPPPRRPADFETMKQVGEMYQATPLLMAAHYLQNERYNLEYFVQTLKGLRDSIHHYTTYQIPKDALLGRYEVHLEASLAGETRGSGTAAMDYFFVEALELLHVESRGTHRVASVENLSPTPVLAHLCEFPADGDARKNEMRLIQLPPKAVSEISFQGSAFLLYLEGTEMLRLSAKDDPFCVRNPELMDLRKPDGSYYVFRGGNSDQEKGFLLSKYTAEVWELSDGFRTRNRVRNQNNATAYDTLLEQGIILEVM